MRTFGVEEELLLVDGVSGEPLPAAARLLEGTTGDGSLTTEFQLEQVELIAGPCTDLQELAAEIRRLRSQADTAAQQAGARTAALATSPLPVMPHTTPSARYQAMIDHYGKTSREQLTCGCHVHVGVASDDEGVAVLDRIRSWLPVLTAVSANSPYWQGDDTGYAGFRTQVWQRLPVTGPNHVFGSAPAYRSFVDSLMETGVPLDEGTIYFDARLSRRHPTVEVRVPDVCLDAGDTMLLAALVRALVETAARQWHAGQPPREVPAAVLQLAGWQASKWGLEGQLLHPVLDRPCPAGAAVEALLDHVRPVLVEAGDAVAVESQLAQVLARGTGARRQRSVLAETGRLADVVLDAVGATTSAG